MSSLWQAPKDPQEVKDYSINWAPELAAGETIVAQVWSLVAGTDGALTIVDQSMFTNTQAIVWVSGGTADIDYELLCHITTSSAPYARELEKTMRLKCRNE